MEDMRRAWWTFMANARWFGGKGREGSLDGITPLAWYTARGEWPAIRSEIAEIGYETGATEHYHLLVAYHQTDRPDALGSVELPGFGRCFVTDAVADPEAVTTLGRAVAPAAGPARVWIVDQSNSMIALGDNALIKVFRKLEPGPNLDAELLGALAGVDTPKLLGRLSVSWPEGVNTDVGLVMERMLDSEDGFVLATAACAENRNFTNQATELGRALRRVHARLADVFGVSEVVGDRLADAMASRLDAACRDVPGLLGLRPAALAAFDALRGRQLEVQRIHGDFHLGQALWSARGWTIIDFEGEPAKPVSERRRPDSRWRDVAGLLRSLDYATSQHPDPQSTQAISWANQARDAFWSGYCGATDELLDVVTAYEIDKAIYEVGYELRNRPDWVAIPMRALNRLLRADEVREEMKE